ncbi:helix-turn-helix domain-containing protein [Gulosibacter bifidus]|uniref:Helix-turn-helix domain-containing protein n=1 Tax=Gulosibacter bifidus TaxID=272239 RepID=A0ABW5RLI8_9MICO|nr:helix-turn-helix transcriptional regulator [Gulosibacter bifidus]
MVTPATFGEFIASRRKQAELTMREFADRIRVTAPYLSDIEKGRRAAPDSKLEAIALALKLTQVEREEMFDLAARTRDHQVSIDLTDYIMDTDGARIALRRAKERALTDEQWEQIVKIIEGDWE